MTHGNFPKITSFIARPRTSQRYLQNGQIVFLSSSFFFFFFRRASSTSPQSLMMVYARNSSILHLAVHQPIAFSHQAAAATRSKTKASIGIVVILSIYQGKDTYCPAAGAYEVADFCSVTANFSSNMCLLLKNLHNSELYNPPYISFFIIHVYGRRSL